MTTLKQRPYGVSPDETSSASYKYSHHALIAATMIFRSAQTTRAPTTIKKSPSGVGRLVELD